MYGLISALAAFCRDERGTVKIEFLVVLPLIFTWIVTSFVLFDAYRTLSRASKATYAVADIVSRQELINITDLLRYHDIFDSLIPWSNPDKSIILTTFTYERPLGATCYDDGDATGECEYVVSSDSCSSGSDSGLQAGDTIPQNILNILPDIAGDDHVILTETVVPYAPLIERFGFERLEFRNRLAVRSRFAPELMLDCTDNSSPTS